MHQGMEVARKFFSGTSRSYDKVVKITTFGQDALWKKRILDLIPSGNFRVLDLACGTGILALAIAEKVSEVVGVDIMEESVRIAREKARAGNISNASFFVSAAEDMPTIEKEGFDFVTASYLPKYCDKERVISEVMRVLKPGGMLIMHDFTYPSSHMMRWVWDFYFKILRVVGIFTPSWRPVFNELDDVIRRSDWVNELIHLMKRHGFDNINQVSLTLGTSAIVSGRYK